MSFETGLATFVKEASLSKEQTAEVETYLNKLSPEAFDTEFRAWYEKKAAVSASFEKWASDNKLTTKQANQVWAMLEKQGLDLGQLGNQAWQGFKGLNPAAQGAIGAGLAGGAAGLAMTPDDDESRVGNALKYGLGGAALGGLGGMAYNAYGNKPAAVPDTNSNTSQVKLGPQRDINPGGATQVVNVSPTNLMGIPPGPRRIPASGGHLPVYMRTPEFNTDVASLNSQDVASTISPFAAAKQQLAAKAEAPKFQIFDR